MARSVIAPTVLMVFLWRGELREPAGLRRRRSSALQRCSHLKPEYEGIAAGRVSQGLSVWRVKELISQPKPAAQLGRGLCYRPGPSLTGQCSFDFREGRVLPQRKQRNSRALRDRQFEATGFRKAHEGLADERCIWCPIHELAALGLPSNGWFRKLML